MGRGHGRLADLGFSSYDDYLRSPHWLRTRAKAGDAAGWKCACGRRATQIHHRTYQHVGEERPGDLRAVCTDCHKEIHRLKDSGMPLGAATDAVLKRARPVNPDGLRVVELPAAGRPKKQKRHKPKKQKKIKRPKPPSPPKLRGVSKVRVENDRLHELQVRNRERQEAARREREYEASRDERRLQMAAASSSPAGAPGGSSGSTRSPDRA